MEQEIADVWMSVTFLKAVIQAILLFGLETWVVTPRIGRTLGGFHDRVVCRLTDKHPKRRTDGM